MRKSCLFVVVLFSMMLVGNLVSAKTLTHEAGKVEITIPDGWKEVASEDSLTVTSPDDSLAVVFSMFEAKEADKCFDNIDKELEKALGEIKWENDGKAKVTDCNGMPCSEWSGTAKDGKMFVDCDSIDTPADKTLGIYYFSTEESLKKFEKDLDALVRGIKPLAAAPAPEPAPAEPAAATEEPAKE
ncbi:MAG: hypothetical protein HQM10_15475 [Candidatus Riflebacteria bacterium]|nr:hypothetical protein [Candidatus Riflebacteria bacterium]